MKTMGFINSHKENEKRIAMLPQVPSKRTLQIKGGRKEHGKTY